METSKDVLREEISHSCVTNTLKRIAMFNQSNTKPLQNVRLQNAYRRLRTVSLSDNSHPTGVVNLRCKDPIFLQRLCSQNDKH